VIELPWPHKILWPNGRTRNTSYKAAETAKHKLWAWTAAKEAKLVAPDGRIPVLLRFHPKPKGPAPDKDNAQASAKAYLDGIAKAMGVDDRLFDPRTEIAPERLSKVVVVIGEGN
jgi:crossover junction endodeoxyribonuclease RusA